MCGLAALRSVRGDDDRVAGLDRGERRLLPVDEHVRLCIHGDRQRAPVGRRHLEHAVRERVDDPDGHGMPGRQVESLEHPCRLAWSPRHGDDEPTPDAAERHALSVDEDPRCRVRPECGRCSRRARQDDRFRGDRLHDPFSCAGFDGLRRHGRGRSGEHHGRKRGDDRGRKAMSPRNHSTLIITGVHFRTVAAMSSQRKRASFPLSPGFYTGKTSRTPSDDGGGLRRG